MRPTSLAGARRCRGTAAYNIPGVCAGSKTSLVMFGTSAPYRFSFRLLLVVPYIYIYCSTTFDDPHGPLPSSPVTLLLPLSAPPHLAFGSRHNETRFRHAALRGADGETGVRRRRDW